VTYTIPEEKEPCICGHDYKDHKTLAGDLACMRFDGCPCFKFKLDNFKYIEVLQRLKPYYV
jgi:hypothetical protein